MLQKGLGIRFFLPDIVMLIILSHKIYTPQIHIYIQTEIQWFDIFVRIHKVNGIRNLDKSLVDQLWSSPIVKPTQHWVLAAPGPYRLLTLKTTQYRLDTPDHVTMDYDKLLVSVGQFGRFQKFIYFFGCLFYIGACFDNMGYVFLSALPEHWCMIPGTGDLNLTENQKKDLSFPVETLDEETTHRLVLCNCEKIATGMPPRPSVFVLSVLLFQ